MGIVVATEMASVAIFGIPGGAVSARLGARRTLVVTNALSAPLIVSVPLLHWAGLLSFPLLLGIVFAAGSFWAPYFAAQRVALPEILGEDERLISEANALLQAAQRITLLLGPVAAGVLIGAIGAPAVLVVDSASFAFALVTILLFVPRGISAVADESRGLLAGVRYLLRDRLLRSWTASFTLGDAAWQALFAALPFYAFVRYHGDAKLAGLLFACFGVASVAGNALSFRIRPRVDGLRLVAVGVMGQALPLWFLVVAGPAWIIALALLLAGLANGIVNPSLHGMTTMRVPAPLRAQTLSAVMTIDTLAAPIGYLAAGVVLDHFGTGPVFLAVPAIQTAAMGAMALASLRERRRPAPAFA